MSPDDPLARHLLTASQACVRPPVDRFRHPWLAPMPLSAPGRAYLARRGALHPDDPAAVDLPATDGFTHGDYGLGLFHHDVSEAAIELVRDEALREACVGSLLCFLDGQAPDGRVHRIELPWKAREQEPAKPVMAQLAWRCAEAGGPEVLAAFDAARVLPRLQGWLAFLERAYTGLHGLPLTHGSLQSGFDNDVLTAGQPDRTVEGPDTATFTLLEHEALARLARALGRDDVAAVHEERAARLRWLVETLLWTEDDRGGFYVGLRWQRGAGALEQEVVADRDPDGVLRPLESWVGLLPLYAGIPSPARAEAMIRRLTAPDGYWGPRGPRTLPRWSPYFHQAARVLHYDPKKGTRGPVSNWCGPVWVLASYYLAAGLARYGRADLAREVTRRTLATLRDDLRTTGRLHECYDDDGRGLWPLRGGFVSWNVLALTMARRWGADDHAPGDAPPR